MFTESRFIESHLNETLGYEMGEAYEELLYDWYGDDLSLFNPDDSDLAIALVSLRKNHLFWHTSPNAISPYQKLRRKYDALLESHMQLVDDYREACSEIEQFEKACQVHGRKTIAVKIKGGCSPAKERRPHEIGKHDIA